MRRLVALAAVALAASAVAVPASAAAPNPGILYALEARDALVDARGHVSLPARTRVTWFTDRPARTAGSTTLRTLVGLWDASGFRRDPPNAALILADGSATRAHVVELSAPTVAEGRVRFRARAVPRAVAAGHRHADALRPGAYARASLFIDDAATPPCGSMLAITTATACLVAPTDVGGTTLTIPLGSSTVWDVYACDTGSAWDPWTVSAPWTPYDEGAIGVPECGTLVALIFRVGAPPQGALAWELVVGPSGPPYAKAPPTSPLLLTIVPTGGNPPGAWMNMLPNPN